jgi:hypothetical protein
MHERLAHMGAFRAPMDPPPTDSLLHMARAFRPYWNPMGVAMLIVRSRAASVWQ